MRLFSEKLRVGLDLGSTHIKLVGLRLRDQDFNLEFAEVVDLVREYSLESFHDITEAHYVEQLRKLVAKHDLKNAKVAAVLPSSSAIIQILKVGLSQTDSEMAEKIQNELRRVSSDNLDEMQITCHELDESESEDDEVPLLVCAVATAVVERFKRIIHESGLNATVLDLDALAVYNAFYYFSNKLSCGPTTMLQIGSQFSICVILLPGKNPFFHVIKLAGNDITKQVMAKTKSTFSEAESIKLGGNHSEWSDIGYFQDLALQKIHSEFSAILLSEVKKCIRHIQSHEDIIEFERVYLTGGGAQIDSLIDFFQESLHIDTEIWNPINQLLKDDNNNGETNQFQSGIYLAPAVGTALRGD